jgi:phage terminase small subunit
MRAELVKAGTPIDLATVYANAFAEYQEAMENIRSTGAVVANPRTGAPIDNPFLKVRDRAEEKLTKLGRRVKGAAGLWAALQMDGDGE